MPEARGLGDDQDVAAGDADFDRSNTVTEGVADLLLDLALDARVGERLGRLRSLLFSFSFRRADAPELLDSARAGAGGGWKSLPKKPGGRGAGRVRVDEDDESSAESFAFGF